MKKVLFNSCWLILFLGVQLIGHAQQNVQYTQFMLNDYGLNPAVAGSNKGIFFMVGRRVQWSGFDLAPETNFASVTKDFGKKGFRLFWHGVGAYVEQDKVGLFATKTVSASYAIHLKLSSKFNMSVGVAAGIKQTQLSSTAHNTYDPALLAVAPKVLGPDIVPGIYLYSKKVTFGISARNIYQMALKQGSKEIGTESRLRPNVYITLSRKFVSSGYDFIFIPAAHVQTTFVNIPVISLNCVALYRRRVGVGVSYRIHDAVAAMLQVRVLKNVVLGFSYDFTVSRLRTRGANATEMMMGLSPVMSSENYDRPTGAAECPRFEL